ncbi:MAG: hypothetical protein WC471_03000 [Candidatus Woesearchaeota archaeon]
MSNKDDEEADKLLPHNNVFKDLDDDGKPLRPFTATPLKVPQELDEKTWKSGLEELIAHVEYCNGGSIHNPQITISIPMPKFVILQKVYIPQRHQEVYAIVLGYEVRLAQIDGKMRAVVTGYFLPIEVSIRRGPFLRETSIVPELEMYTDQAAANTASRFLKVDANDIEWRKALGCYNAVSGELASLANNLNNKFNLREIVDILFYCKSQGGLIVHEYKELLAGLGCTEQKLKELLNLPGIESLKKILMQLMS